MSAVLQNLVNQPYKHGFVTDIESDVAPNGLNEDTIRLISAQWWVYFLAPVLSVPIFIRLGLYRAIFRYTGQAALVTTAKAVAPAGSALPAP